MWADRRRDGRTDGYGELIVAFRNFAKSAKKSLFVKIHMHLCFYVKVPRAKSSNSFVCRRGKTFRTNLLLTKKPRILCSVCFPRFLPFSIYLQTTLKAKKSQ
jgi:hypothetical protein